MTKTSSVSSAATLLGVGTIVFAKTKDEWTEEEEARTLGGLRLRIPTTFSLQECSLKIQLARLLPRKLYKI